MNQQSFYLLKSRQPYYKIGPQQGSGPDGYWDEGTKVQAKGPKIGAYWQCESEDKVVAYVDSAALDRT